MTQERTRMGSFSSERLACIAARPVQALGVEDERRVARNANTGLFSVHQAAEFLGVSERTLWTITDEGNLACIRVRRRKMYSQVDLAAYIDAQRSHSIRTQRGAA